MNAEPDTIRSAIESYAVMLNRPQWLDESRTLMQEAVWGRLVKRQPGTTMVQLEHFEAAIEGFLVGGHDGFGVLRPLDVTVPAIVSVACRMADADAHLVGLIYAAWEAGDPLLLDAVSRALAMNGPGLDAVADLRRAAVHRSRVVATSNLDGHDVDAIIDQIDTERVAAETEMMSRSRNVPMLPDGEADSVIAEWLGRP